MKFSVFGSTGNTGSVVVNALLAAGADVRAVVRRPEAARLDARVEVVRGSLAEPRALTDALRGVDGVYLLSPPTPSTSDFIAERREMFDGVADALVAARVPHVVLLSSIGGQHEAGTGVIRTVAGGERALASKGVAVTSLRAAYFQQNWGMALGALSDGIVPTMFGPPERAIPMVAVDDIGRTAAQLLLDGPGNSARVVELAGPREYSPQDVATALSAATGKALSVVVVPPEQRVSTLTGFGIGEDQAKLYAEMYAGIENGTVSWENPESVRRGSVELRTSLDGLLAGNAG